MAKVKSPLMSQEARGGINGFVYNTWRGISYVKTNTSPTGQGTALRLAAQALLIAAAQAWQLLDDAERALWAAYAVAHPITDWTGNPKRLTGANWYTRIYCSLTRHAVAVPDPPPTDPAPAAPIGFAITKPAGNLSASWTSPTTAAHFVDINIVGPLSAGLTAKLEMTKFLTGRPGTDFAGVDIWTTPPSGRWTAFARTVDAATGLVSSWVSDFYDVA